MARTTLTDRGGFGPVDQHLFNEGRHERLWEKLGAHRIGDHVRFALWAPNARSISVVGDWNNWDGRVDRMEPVGSTGVWETVVAEVAEGAHYKYEIKGADGNLRLKMDPFAFWTEIPPGTASRVFTAGHEWNDDEW